MTTAAHDRTDRRTRAVAFLAAHWPSDGRHACYLALAGGLLGDGVPKADVEDVVATLAAATHDEKADRRRADVADTDRKIRSREKATGWPTLAKCLGERGPRTVSEFRRLLGLTINLADLAAHKRLSLSFLTGLGLHDLDTGGVGIPYPDASGRPIAVKKRTGLTADSSRWPYGKPLMAYGEDRLPEAVTAGRLVLVEGESDCWTLWHHGCHALGLPGANTVHKALQLGHVSCIRELFVVEESGAGGKEFVKNVRERLGVLRWNGTLRVVRLPVKDPSELHCQNPERFKGEWEKAVAAAEVVGVISPAQETGRKQGEPEPWPAPIPLSSPPKAPPFPVDVFPEVLQRFLREAAAALPCPPDYLAVPLLVMAGGMIGASRAVAIKNKHVQRAVLYAAVIGPPGSAKTPALEAVVEPIGDVEERLQEKYDAEREQYERDMAEYEAKKKAAKANEKKGTENDEPLPEKPKEPVLQRYTVDDTTVEALVPILKENPRGVVQVCDELIAWVQRLNCYRAGGKGADRQFYLSAWSGRDYVNDRKIDRQAGPVRLRKPFVAVVGGLVPDKLTTLRGDQPRQRVEQDGFLDRLLLSYPKEPEAVGENWSDIAEETTEALARVFANLALLQMVPHQQITTIRWRPFLVKLTGSAKDVWQRFTQQLADDRNAEDFPPHLAGPWAKFRGYCGRLALIIHFLRWACGDFEDDRADVDGESMARAVRLIDYFKGHARKVYAAIDADPRIADTRHVLRWLEDHPVPEVFSRRDVHQGLRRNTRFENPENLDAPLQLLVEYGFIRPLDPGNTGRVAGRPASTRYTRNPLWRHPQSVPVRPDALV